MLVPHGTAAGRRQKLFALHYQGWLAIYNCFFPERGFFTCLFRNMHAARRRLLAITFDGFPREFIRFFRELGGNNSKAWFERHRHEYESFVMEPARSFVREMGHALAAISPGIIADPRVNQSIFKIHRDVRFSRDKTPLKTHLGIWFWEGERTRMECSGYYLQVEAGGVMLGTGVYEFSRDTLQEFRESLVHSVHGPAFTAAVKKVRKKGYEMGGEHYKKIPRGYDQAHPNAEFFLYNGLYAGYSGKVPGEFFTGDFVRFCLARYREMAPVHEWLVQMIRRADARNRTRAAGSIDARGRRK